jgi:hypothetical protein
MNHDDIIARSHDSFIAPPKFVGSYRIGDSGSYLQINLKKKPNWLHRKMMLLCFGWEWVDA